MRKSRTVSELPVIDASGLTCPRPVLMLADALPTIPVGATTILVATDPTSKVDVPVWCRRHGHAVTAIDDSGDVFRFTVKRQK